MTKLANLSTADLTAELARRERTASKLQRQRAQLVTQLEALERELGSLGVAAATHGRSRGGAASSSRKRPKNSLPLPEAIAAAMEVGAVVSPKEAAQLVLNNGYKTTSKTFGGQVANVLAKDPRFKKMGRAQFKRTK